LVDDASENDGSTKDDEFVMTSELYQKFKNDQVVFEEKLKSIIEKVT